MTQLETLIQTLCPNGVKRYKLKEIAELKRGVVISKDYINEHAGEYPVYSSQTENNGCLGYIDTYAYDGTYLTWTTDGANAGTIFYREGKFNITNVCGLVIITNPQISVKYLYYILSITAPKYVNRGMGNPKLMSNVMQELQIPLPPLAVQSEIVRVLDKFTLHKAELAAELTARLRQYEYYRDKLLTFDDTVKRVKIQDVSTMICSGGTPSASNTSYYNGNIPWLRTQEVDWKDITDTSIKITELGLKNSSAKWIPENCVIVAMYGATAGKVAINKIPLTTNQACCNIKVDETKILYRFLFHYLCHSYKIIKGMGQGSQSNINAQMLKSFLIPLPPLSEQERIVSILDRFDKLCHDIREGLPAEIDLRQKQYEHYRDKLLTFNL